MASQDELVQNHTKEELVEKAKDANLSGYSTLNKDELAAQLANLENEGGNNTPLADQQEPAHEGGRGVAQTESLDAQGRADALQAEKDSVHVDAKSEGSQDKATEDAPDAAKTTGYASEGSDASDQDVVDELSPSGKEALDELGNESAAKADLALDASGPLHLQSPAERIMTGAVSEEQAKEQEKATKSRPDEYVGDVTEAGFAKDGTPVVAHGAVERNKVAGSEKDNLHKSDKRELREVRQEDVIDFPPPVGQRNFDPKNPKKETVQAAPSGPFSAHISPVAALDDPTLDARRGYQQKSVFYTDGLSGSADHNHERAYEYGELLQSNDPQVREAGDQSVSEAAWEAKSDAEKHQAQRVKERDDDPSQVSRNSDK